MSYYDRIPGYWAAVAAEAEARDAAWLDEPLLVAGHVVRPLTLRDYLRLSRAHSPFVCGGKVDRRDVAFLLWFQRPVGSPVDEEERVRFVRRFDALDLDSLSLAAGEFVDRALRDRPNGNPGGSAPVVGIGSVFVHVLMRAYPQMSKDDVLDLSLEPLWQLYRNIQLEHNPKALFSNALSDRAKGEHARRRQQELDARLAAEARRAKRRKPKAK